MKPCLPPKKKPVKKPVAKFSIQCPGAMTVATRTKIANWMEKQARSLKREGHNYTATGCFTARQF